MSNGKTIGQWLAAHGFGQYADVFSANDIDIHTLTYLTEDDLKELGVSLGHRRRMLAAASKLTAADPVTQPDPVELRRSRAAKPERRQLTTMFCDIVGSTALTRQMDPEDMREVLRQYQDVIGDAVRRYQGYVARFVGDGILCYFGWPQAFEDQAERAVLASLEAASAVSNVKLDSGEILQIRFGIDTGEVVVGDLVGQETSDTETVTGLSPNLAARLQGIAKPGQVVIGQNTRNLIGGVFELEALGSQELKGFPDEVLAWSVVGAKQWETRFEAARGTDLSGLVGREHELGLLQDRWKLTKGGEGQVVLLCGEAGIGKSRMVQDFWSSVGKELRFNLHYQCSPHHTNSAFYPVIQRLQRAARFSSEDGVEEKLNKLEQLLRIIGGDVISSAPLLAKLLSLPSEERFGLLELTPQQLRQQTVEALIGQMISLSKRRPILSVVEDVHWIDPSMRDFVTELISRIPEHPIFVLITSRPENAPVWDGHPHITSITLNRLGRKHAAEIAQQVGGQELMEVIIDRIVVRAEGIPLYVEELTKTVLESYTLDKPPALDELIPQSLQSSLIARLDRLDEAKEIAQIGAVIGREFSHELLEKVSERPLAALETALNRLVESGLLFRRGTPPNAEYRFKHSLIQDAAYTTILIRQRRGLHSKIVLALEAFEHNEHNQNVESLAYHALQGEMWDKAFGYLQHAGRKAIDRAAVREAVAHFEQALSVVNQFSESQELLEQAIDLRFDLRNALWAIADFEEILVNLKKAESLARKLQDDRRMGWISVFLSASLWQLGRADEAAEAATKALDINRKADDLPLEVGANFYLGCTTVTSGNCQQAEVYFEKIANMLEGDLKTDRCGLPFVPAVVSRSWLVWSMAERGEFNQGLAHAEIALDIAKDVGHPFNLAHIYYDLGYFYQIKGETDNAVEALEMAMDYVREWSLTYLSPFIMGFLGHSYVHAGNIEGGTALLRQALSDYQAMGLGLFRSLVTVHMAHALYLGENLAEAQEVAEDGLALARKRGEQGHEAHALRQLGEICCHPNAMDLESAKSHFQSAMGLAESHSMRPMLAHCYLGLGQVAKHTNAQRDSQEYASKASGIFQELGIKSAVFPLLK
ncbi:MAG: adenylate/guanylate cyclase domain-containing protein [bacterium]